MATLEMRSSQNTSLQGCLLSLESLCYYSALNSTPTLIIGSLRYPGELIIGIDHGMGRGREGLSDRPLFILQVPTSAEIPSSTELFVFGYLGISYTNRLLFS